jgi:hypothetical protein
MHKTGNVLVTMMRIHATIIAVKKEISITYSECVCVFVALGIHDSVCLRHIVICGLSGFPYFIINDKIFEKKIIENKIYLLIISTNLFEIR